MNNNWNMYKNNSESKNKCFSNKHQSKESKFPNSCSDFRCNWVKIQEDEKINEIRKIIGEDV